MMSFKLSIGKLAFAGTDLYTNEAIAALTVKHPERLSPDFLFHYLSHVDWVSLSAGNEKVKGATLNKAKLAEVAVPVPPLAEQQRIVAKLDEIDSNLRTLIEHLDAEYLRSAQVRLSAADSLFGRPGCQTQEGSLVSSNWQWLTLGEVCEVRNGATPDTNIPHYWDGPHAWVTPAEMGGLDSPYVSTTRRTLTDQGLAACSASPAPEKSVILSSRAPIGHLVINEVPMATNQGCKTLVPSSSLNFKFLYYFLKAHVPLLESLGTGATFRELSAGKLKEVTIPVAPLAEQQRIVAKLDEIDSLCAEVSENIERRKAKAGELRQSVLAAAFRGEL
jgi:restriction endonuclease S subunit